MDFIRRRLSMSSAEPDINKEEKVEDSPTAAGHSPTLLESISAKRASLWNDITSRVKSDHTTPNGSEMDPPSQSATPSNKSSNPTFMESVKQRLKLVHQQYERANNESDEERSGTNVECAPLIDTSDHEEADGNHSSVVETDNATTHSEVLDGSTAAPDTQDVGFKRKKLTKRQDSFTAEEVYLDTVAAKVKSGLLPPAPIDSNLISPSKAVKEFVFTDTKAKEKPKLKQKKVQPSRTKLTVDNNNLINFDSIQNLSSAAAQSAEIIIHHEDEIVFDYESSG